MKKKYILEFIPQKVNFPLTYHLITEYGIYINILNAQVSAGQSSSLILEMGAHPDKMEQALNFIKREGISISSVENRVVFNEELCVHCGSCTAICNFDAIKLHPLDKKVQFFPENCTACGLCVKACPLQLFKLNIPY